MNRRHRTTTLILVLLALLFAASQDRFLMRRLLRGPDHGERVQWLSSLDEARVVAARERRPIYVDFFATWCGPCEEMVEGTYRDPDVIRRLNREFVPVMIDIDKQPVMAAQFSVGPIPDGAFLSYDGQPLTRSIGYHDADEFLSILDGALKMQSRLPPLPKGAKLPPSAARPAPPLPMPGLPMGFP
jgi:thiol:disulfide interchange protein